MLSNLKKIRIKEIKTEIHLHNKQGHPDHHYNIINNIFIYEHFKVKNVELKILKFYN
jgi:hypothetical protein